MCGAKFHTLVCRRQPGWVIGTKACTAAPIRDRPLRRPLTSVAAMVIPAPQSSFPRRRESRGGGDGKCSAGACPPLPAAGTQPRSRGTV